MGKTQVPLDFQVSSRVEIVTDAFFLDLLLSDIIRNIVFLSGENEDELVNFSAQPSKNGHTTLLINDTGNRHIFLKSYFQYHEKEAVNVNHNLYLFHNALKKLQCRIINHEDKKNGQTMELIIPHLYQHL